MTETDTDPRAAMKAPVNVFVSFRGLDAERYRHRFFRGFEPDESPYGFHLAESLGFTVVFSKDDDKARSNLVAKTGRRLLGFDVIHALKNLEKARKADVIWTMTEREALAIAFLQKIRLLPSRPIVANIIWLLDNWYSLSFFRQRYYRWIIKEIPVIYVHSKACFDAGNIVLSTPALSLMFFGINTRIFQLTNPTCNKGARIIKIYAPGSDRARDWRTLIDAFGNDERFQITILNSVMSYDVERQYSNLKLLRSRKISDFVQAYLDADFIVIPMIPNIYAGITVALEACALGRPIVCSRTGGVPTYFDEDEITYVSPSDPLQLRQTILELPPETARARAEKAQATFRKRDYSTDAMIARYGDCTSRLLGR